MTSTRKARVSLGGGRSVAALAPGAQDATRERLVHAERDGGEALAQGGVRRLADSFDVLRTRQGLDRQDAGRNEGLWQAGDRFRRHWHLGRLDALKAFDFSRESVDGSGQDAGTPTEAALRHRESYRRATVAVGPRLLPYLTGIVVEGRPIADLRPLVAETGHARTAEALIQERLREALHRLCDHWEIGPATGSAPSRRAGIRRPGPCRG